MWPKCAYQYSNWLTYQINVWRRRWYAASCNTFLPPIANLHPSPFLYNRQNICAYLQSVMLFRFIIWNILTSGTRKSCNSSTYLTKSRYSILKTYSKHGDRTSFHRWNRMCTAHLAMQCTRCTRPNALSYVILLFAAHLLLCSMVRCRPRSSSRRWFQISWSISKQSSVRSILL